MDFFDICESYFPRKKTIEVYPTFKVCRTKDLMIRGRSFYAIWDEEAGLWSTDEYDVARLVDKELVAYAKEKQEKADRLTDIHYTVKYMSDFSSKAWVDFKRYVQSVQDNSKDLDLNVTFSNTPVERKDLVSKKLDYPLESGDISAYDELMSTLYSPEERAKLEWAIGAIVSGDSKKIQKFLVLYGDPGTGKSTVLDIIQKMFKGYYTIFEAKALTSSNNAFSTEAFKLNPLIAIQHDGDLSKIEDNSKLNSIISHEEIVINEKYKSSYPMKVNCFLFMATNKPVKITDAKAGLIRRLIDVRPTGNKLDPDKYYELRDQIEFEYGAIAKHCLDVYREMGKDYYNKYRPVDMMYKTDPFFNFIEDQYREFSENDGISLSRAYSIYKEYCTDANIDYVMQKYKFREALKDYFDEYVENYYDQKNCNTIHNYYTGFKKKKFIRMMEQTENRNFKSWIVLLDQKSQLDYLYSDCDAQLAKTDGYPRYSWDKVTTKLMDLDTSKLHWVKIPENHIVIDFDIPGKDGKKNFELNLEAASKFPKTYAELSKSGAGIHLHYIYEGDVNELEKYYDGNPHIEIKVFKGNSSLRRMLTKCNDIKVAKINSGLPLKEKKKKGDGMVNYDSIQSEVGLRKMIIRNLNKEIHQSTKPSVDFIKKILDDAYNSGMKYDVSDMRQAITTFAANSTHQSDICMKLVAQMKFASEEIPDNSEDYEKDIIVFYDVEVFPNLFIVCWKKLGGTSIVRMINPSPNEIEELFKYKLVGFNCRRYDNHIMYARYMGYSNEELFRLSSKIINAEKGSKNSAFFSNAYNLSYTDIYDYSTNKQSLKKWEIELGIHHQENSYPWDQPLDESHWEEVADYCCNDVNATEAVWEATQADFKAREILVAVCKSLGLNACVNDTTNSLTTKMIFGNNKNPDLVYTELEKVFPGYKYISPKDSEDKTAHNVYKGEEAGFGGYVYVEEGIYKNVALLDVASMHPHSIIAMNCFGEYTQKFKDLVDIRLLIKHKEYEKVKKLLGGALAPYLDDEKQAKELSTALKIPINYVYGLTSAKFDNPFRDSRNVNNIVALRGALFMILLKEEIQKRGFTPFHFKTDSVKIADATPEIIQFVMDFGKKYGYTFEHEATYEKICIVNGSTYIAKYSNDEFINGSHCGEWTATAAQFQHPYVFKKLFTHQKIVFEDICETKEVSRGGDLYLDFNEGLPEEQHNYRFIGRIGLFVPVKEGTGGGLLLRCKDDKFGFATGAKGHRWKEAEVIKNNGLEDDIDYSYHDKLVDDAKAAIEEYGSYDIFVQ